MVFFSNVAATAQVKTCTYVANGQNMFVEKSNVLFLLKIEEAERGKLKVYSLYLFDPI